MLVLIFLDVLSAVKHFGQGCTSWPAIDRNRPVFAYNARSATSRFFVFFLADFSESAPYIVIIRKHVICVEDIWHKHNKHRKTDTKKWTAVGVTLLAHK